jgi:hypothetical protein
MMRRTRSLALVLVLTSLSFGTLAHSAGAAEIVPAKVRPVTIAQAKTHAMKVLRQELVRSQRGQKVLADSLRPDGRLAVPPLTLARFYGGGEPACISTSTGVNCGFYIFNPTDGAGVQGAILITRKTNGRLSHKYVQWTM